MRHTYLVDFIPIKLEVKPHIDTKYLSEYSMLKGKNMEEHFSRIDNSIGPEVNCCCIMVGPIQLLKSSLPENLRWGRSRTERRCRAHSGFNLINKWYAEM